jgi:tetratricopeptide (TPR) repeat protein
VRSLALLGNIEACRGNPARAYAYYDEAIQQATTQEDETSLCEARFHKAFHAMLQGEWESAREGLDAVRRSAMRNDCYDLAAQALVYLGVVSYATGNAEMAFTWWSEVRQVCRGSGSDDCLVALKLWEGRAAFESGDLDTARVRFESAVEYYRRQEHLPGLASALEGLAEVRLAEDSAEDARFVLEELSVVRSRLGLSERGPFQLEKEHAPPGEFSRFQRLSTLLGALPRTALTEERASHIPEQ